MQLAPENIARYEAEAPALLESVTSGEAAFIMKRDPHTDYCVQFDAGWCRIHRDYGDAFLGDACHFYPRITRALNDVLVTSIALSCPEAARLSLCEEGGFSLGPREAQRQPFLLNNYLPGDVAPEAALATHERFLAEAANPAFTAERNLMRLSSVARALAHQPPAQWDDASRFYFTMAEGRLPQAEPSVHDPIHLVQALTGLVQASKATSRPALMALLARMQDAVGIAIADDGAMTVLPDAAERMLRLMHCLRDAASTVQPVLMRYVQAQLSQALFPYAGLGNNVVERLTILAVRTATFKLALGAAAGEGALDDARIVDVAYTLSRFMDHLADATLSLAIYGETGWVREARLRGLLGDAA
jgi:hypothetical protein